MHITYNPDLAWFHIDTWLNIDQMTLLAENDWAFSFHSSFPEDGARAWPKEKHFDIAQKTSELYKILTDANMILNHLNECNIKHYSIKIDEDPISKENSFQEWLEQDKNDIYKCMNHRYQAIQNSIYNDCDLSINYSSSYDDDKYTDYSGSITMDEYYSDDSCPYPQYRDFEHNDLCPYYNHPMQSMSDEGMEYVDFVDNLVCYSRESPE